jgi:putative membrane protein
MSNYYNWFKALHVIAVISWMAGMLYLPRLFVYHCDVIKDGEADKKLRIMENKLIKIIINPAMIITLIFGLLNAYIYGIGNLGGWFHIKMSAVLILMLIHGLLIKWHKNFLKGQNMLSTTFFKIINETITALMIISVIMVVVKPFE